MSLSPRPPITPPGEDVRIKVKRDFPFNLNSDRRWTSPLWEECCQTYQMPRGVRPLGRGHAFWNDRRSRMEFIDLYSPSWWNPANRTFHQRKLRYNGIRELSGQETWYSWDEPAEDWTEKRRDSLAQLVKRHDGEYIAFNTIEARGVVRCLSSFQVPGSVALADPESWLTEAIRDIRTPRESNGERFHPLWGTRELKKALNRPVDKPKDELLLVAKSKNADATDFYSIEANLREAGLYYDLKKPIFKEQAAFGLSALFQNWEHAREFLESMGTYDLLPIAKALSGEEGGLDPGEDSDMGADGAALQRLMEVQ
jgi:hypothetical protein